MADLSGLHTGQVILWCTRGPASPLPARFSVIAGVAIAAAPCQRTRPNTSWAQRAAAIAQ